MTFTVHTVESAPEAATDVFAGAKKAFGFVPNLMGVMAQAPALVKAYRTLQGLFDETSLTPTERQIVLLTASAENECHYCVAAHSAIAGMQRVPHDVVESIRRGKPIEDSRLEALRQFTTTLVNARGWAADEELDTFLQAGFTKAQVLEVVLGIGFKTLSNYTNHIVDTPLDEAFATALWSRAA